MSLLLSVVVNVIRAQLVPDARPLKGASGDAGLHVVTRVRVRVQARPTALHRDRQETHAHTGH